MTTKNYVHDYKSNIYVVVLLKDK